MTDTSDTKDIKSDQLALAMKEQERPLEKDQVSASLLNWAHRLAKKRSPRDVTE